MLGDNEIYGKKTRTLDYKNRIILPKESGIELKEKLIVYEDNGYCSLYSKKYFDKNQNIEGKSFEEKKKELDDLALKIIAIIKVETESRITIPKEILDYYGIEKEVLLVGAKDHINIYPIKKKCQ